MWSLGVALELFVALGKSDERAMAVARILEAASEAYGSHGDAPELKKLKVLAEQVLRVVAESADREWPRSLRYKDRAATLEAAASRLDALCKRFLERTPHERC